MEGLGARVTPGKLGSWGWDSPPTPSDFQILSEGVPRKQVQCMLFVQELPPPSSESLAVLASLTTLLFLACTLASFKQVSGLQVAPGN